jgi:hypothetical protein
MPWKCKFGSSNANFYDDNHSKSDEGKNRLQASYSNDNFMVLS